MIYWILGHFLLVAHDLHFFSSLSPASQWRLFVISVFTQQGRLCCSPVSTAIFPVSMLFRTLPVIKKQSLFFLLETEGEFVSVLKNKVWWKWSHLTPKLGPRWWYGVQLMLTHAPSLSQDIHLWDLTSPGWRPYGGAHMERNEGPLDYSLHQLSSSFLAEASDITKQKDVCSIFHLCFWSTHKKCVASCC